MTASLWRIVAWQAIWAAMGTLGVVSYLENREDPAAYQALQLSAYAALAGIPGMLYGILAVRSADVELTHKQRNWYAGWLLSPAAPFVVSLLI
ncbi:MAG: hypothetical protein KDA61_17360 [Planctomycetales bacterium]|nr:hypothetical protein [Planctomycetales bacterium]